MSFLNILRMRLPGVPYLPPPPDPSLFDKNKYKNHPLLTYRHMGHCFPEKKDLYRRQGTGRCCYFGDRIYSISYHTNYFALGRYEEQDELNQDGLRKGWIHHILFELSWWKIAIVAIFVPNQQQRFLPYLLYTSFSFAVSTL